MFRSNYLRLRRTNPKSIHTSSSLSISGSGVNNAGEDKLVLKGCEKMFGKRLHVLYVGRATPFEPYFRTTSLTWSYLLFDGSIAIQEIR